MMTHSSVSQCAGPGFCINWERSDIVNTTSGHKTRTGHRILLYMILHACTSLASELMTIGLLRVSHLPLVSPLVQNWWVWICQQLLGCVTIPLSYITSLSYLFLHFPIPLDLSYLIRLLLTLITHMLIHQTSIQFYWLLFHDSFAYKASFCHILEIWLSPTPIISGRLWCHLQSCIVASLYARKVIIFYFTNIEIYIYYNSCTPDVTTPSTMNFLFTIVTLYFLQTSFVICSLV